MNQGMVNAEAVRHLARILGRERFRKRLGLADSEPHVALSPSQASLLHNLIEENLQPIVDSLLEEALASDDITSAESADSYLEGRLAFLRGLLTETQQAEIRRRFRNVSSRWS